MFGRAAIRLGIGPHSSFSLFYFTTFFLCYELGIATVLVHSRSTVFLMFRCAFCHALIRNKRKNDDDL